ncbi:hypothetical protein [Chryseobacterium limigenitum]|uniref:Uncharacterized protein n=1 Tax=Chryseobacterium limigenitum TaxID=1612149 RepID=A0A1K2IWQ9_9FLAO|nr:hypothetical protein [Chryseobacterium limigenitum]SFZ96718.1 hypothetical protein SAMN05216324_12439 [Chryseobacterium limigenitum]
MEKKHLTDEEFKKLVIEIAIKISPILVEKKPDSWSAAENIAIYSKDIAEAVRSILIDPSGKSL